MSDTDLELLERYVRRRDEDAFAEVVRRHLGLVYSAAVRQVRSPQLAEEVAQAVFVSLAREAGRLRPDTILAAWLYRVAHHTAANVVRGEVRRLMREQFTAEMNAVNAGAHDWKDIEPFLDEAMHALDEIDRAAVILRFFENKSLREVGASLGTSENAAQKRLTRAVERLRDFFAERGIAIGAGGLVGALSTNAVQAAPAGLAYTISTAAALSGAILASTTGTATKVFVMTTVQKGLVVAALTIAVGGALYEVHQTSAAREEILNLKQQHTLLGDQLEQMTRERDAFARQLAAIATDDVRQNRATAELMKLRGEVARLRGNGRVAAEANSDDSGGEAVAKPWLARVRQLKEYVDQNPVERIPEFQFLTEREWLSVADAGLETERFSNDDEFRRAMEGLRFQAEMQFGAHVQGALKQYSLANKGQFPPDVPSLVPFCEPDVGTLLQQAYEIKPASHLPEATFENLPIEKPDWVIVRRVRVNSNSTSRLAICVNALSYWQSQP